MRSNQRKEGRKEGDRGRGGETRGRGQQQKKKRMVSRGFEPRIQDSKSWVLTTTLQDRSWPASTYHKAANTPPLHLRHAPRPPPPCVPIRNHHGETQQLETRHKLKIYKQALVRLVILVVLVVLVTFVIDW